MVKWRLPYENMAALMDSNRNNEKRMPIRKKQKMALFLVSTRKKLYIIIT